MDASTIEKNMVAEEIEQKRKTKLPLEKYSGMGAMVACLLASLFVIEYLLATVITVSYINVGNLMSFILGSNHGMDTLAPEGLFVVVTRFLIVFSITWLPSTAIIARIKEGK